MDLIQIKSRDTRGLFLLLPFSLARVATITRWPWVVLQEHRWDQSHTFNHSFARMCLKAILTFKRFRICWGRDVKTTMIYTHVFNREPVSVRSLLDGLWIPSRRWRYAGPPSL
jgi:hypothetical protein